MSDDNVHNSQDEIVITEQDILDLGIRQYLFSCSDNTKLPYCQFISKDDDIAAKEITNNRFRVINVYDEQSGRYIELLTNIMHLSAQTVSQIYKDRWQIELFFKALKQNLKVKSFVGTSENAVRIQIWTALISILLLKYLQLRSSWSWSFSNLVAFLRMILLRHIDLWDWLDNPFVRGEDLPPGEVTGNIFEAV